MTPLQKVSETRNLNTLNVFLTHPDIQINLKGKVREGKLMKFCFPKLILRLCFFLFTNIQDGHTALYEAAYWGGVVVVEVLLSYEYVDVDARGSVN
jgi:hypothetical protein